MDPVGTSPSKRQVVAEPHGGQTRLGPGTKGLVGSHVLRNTSFDFPPVGFKGSPSHYWRYYKYVYIYRDISDIYQPGETTDQPRRQPSSGIAEACRAMGPLGPWGVTAAHGIFVGTSRPVGGIRPTARLM